jgi:hypothetical protein
MGVKQAQRTLGKWWESTSHFFLPFLLAGVVLVLSSVIGWWAGLLALLGIGGFVGLTYVRAEFGEDVLKSDAEKKREIDEVAANAEELIREEEEERKREEEDAARPPSASKGAGKPAGKR